MVLEDEGESVEVERHEGVEPAADPCPSLPPVPALPPLAWFSVTVLRSSRSDDVASLYAPPP